MSCQHKPRTVVFFVEENTIFSPLAQLLLIPPIVNGYVAYSKTYLTSIVYVGSSKCSIFQFTCPHKLLALKELGGSKEDMDVISRIYSTPDHCRGSESTFQGVQLRN